MSISHSFCTNSSRTGPFSSLQAICGDYAPSSRSKMHKEVTAAVRDVRRMAAVRSCHSEMTAVVPSRWICLGYCCARLSAGCHGFHYATGGVSLENGTRLMRHGELVFPLLCCALATCSAAFTMAASLIGWKGIDDKPGASSGARDIMSLMACVTSNSSSRGRRTP